MPPLTLLLPIIQAIASQRPAPTGAVQAPDAPAQDANAAALIAAVAALAQQRVAPRASPQGPPTVLSWLAVLLPVATVAAAAVLVYAATTDRDAVTVAVAVILGAFLTLSAIVVQWFAGSSIGSWSKNNFGSDGDSGGVIIPPIEPPGPEPGPKPPLPEPEPPAPAPKANFDDVHAIIAKWEGGYSDHPSDPGGATNYGITLETLSDWRGKPQTKADVKALTYDEALKIFKVRYWDKLSCGEMHPAVALMTYNAGVNSGISRGARFLQECLNKQGAPLEVDGSVGPLTLAAAAKADVRRVVDDYAETYEAFYRSLKTFPTFGKGWLNRLTDVTARAREWSASEPQAPDDDLPTGADLLRIARPHIGEKYVFGARAPKDIPHYKGPWDCAEFVSWVIYQAAGIPYGWTDRDANPADADAYTGAFQRDAQTLGKMVSVETAAATPGAILLRYPGAAVGHVVFSDGKGGTVEAASTNLGVIAGKVAGRRWDTGILIPGIDYSEGSAVDASGPAVIYAVGAPNMRSDVIKSIQTELAEKGFSVTVDGEYGAETAAAVSAFQQQAGVVPDGEVGEVTAPLLGVTL